MDKKGSIKILVTDMDGTLLDGEHRVSKENYRAIEHCTRRGIQVVLASGRSFFSVRPHALELGLAGAQISLNGGMVADAGTGKVHGLHTLTHDNLRRILTRVEELGFCPIVFSGSGIYSPVKGKDTALIESFGEPEITIVSRNQLGSLADPVKVLINYERGTLDEQLAQEFGPSILTIRTGALFLEFQTPGVSKGEALRSLMMEKGIREDEVIALGDNDNDVSLFQTARWSFAVANATQAARAAARFQTVSHLENAVAQVVDSYFLGRAPFL